MYANNVATNYVPILSETVKKGFKRSYFILLLGGYLIFCRIRFWTRKKLIILAALLLTIAVLAIVLGLIPVYIGSGSQLINLNLNKNIINLF